MEPRIMLLDRFSVVRTASLLRPVTLLASLLLVQACEAPSSPRINAHSLVRPLSGPCPTDGSVAGGEFAAEVQSFAATITGPDIAEPLRAEGAAPLVIEDVPAGPARVIALFGLANGQASWRGVSRPIEILAGQDNPVDVLMARVADLSCARSTSQDKRAFHTATLLDDGSVLVVGGAREIVDASATCGAGCKRATATSSASVYDPRTGTFVPVGGLTTPRMFHTAAKLADGRVVVAGGTREALLRPVDPARFPFPIDPTAPLSTIEVYDPASRSFSPVGTDPGGARVFAAATTLLTGEVIITGGIPATDPSRHDLGNALNTSTVCGGGGLVCQVGPPLARRRAGHIAFTLDPDGVYLWGGSVEPGDVDGVAGFHFEILRPAQPTFTLIEMAKMQATRNVFFAGAAQYLDFRVIAIGGLLRDPATGAFDFALADGGEGGAVYVFDRAADSNGGLATGKDSNAGKPAMRTQSPRFLSAAAGLPGERTAIVAGGFTSLAFDSVAELERYSENDLTLSPLPVGGENRALREPRGGLTATSLGDGTVLFVGGLTTGIAPLETAEIYADIDTPPQAAPLE